MNGSGDPMYRQSQASSGDRDHLRDRYAFAGNDPPARGRHRRHPGTNPHLLRKTAGTCELRHDDDLSARATPTLRPFAESHRLAAGPTMSEVGRTAGNLAGSRTGCHGRSRGDAGRERTVEPTVERTRCAKASTASAVASPSLARTARIVSRLTSAVSWSSGNTCKTVPEFGIRN